MSFKTVSAILDGKWMLDKNWASNHMPMVLLLLQGKEVSFAQRSGNEQTEQPFCIDASTGIQYSLNVYDGRNERMIPNPNIPPNSVGVLPISGPITKYNGSCGIPGGISMASTLMQMLNTENIGSIIQLIDTPGGESGAANNYCAIAEASPKPILTYVNGRCASLGIMFASCGQETYLSNELDQMGSIGSYCSFLDFSGYLEKEGIKLHEVYAPQSIDKNKNYKDAMQGDYSCLEEELEILVDAFINYVAKSRGGKPSDSIKEWNSGKMFFAKDAVKLGLADGIKPFNQVVSKAAWLAKRNKN